ncbi:Clp protease N-terminal domain-containing protein [Streptomyces sp. HD1123-B1]
MRALEPLSAPEAQGLATQEETPVSRAPVVQTRSSGFQFERYTDRARQAVVSAQEEARGLKHNYIGGEHLLLGLLTAEGVAGLALESLGVSYEWAHGRIMEVVGPGTETPTGHIPFTPRAKKVMELALREAATLDHRYIGVEHLLLGLMREGEGVAVQLLTGFLGEDGPRRVRERVVRLITDPPQEQVQQQEPSVPEPPVPAEPPVTASRDLTEAARRSRLDPVAGREREIQRLMQVLMRKSRNSALLVGEAGVGRTSIVMGLAQRLAGGEAPAGLSGVRLRAVHPGRLRTALAELRDPATTVLFLDDADLAEGSDTLSALRDSGVRVIAVVEPAAHRPALETFFQPVPVGEPSLEDTVAILRLLRPEYERHHAVSITDDALEAAVTLTVRHLPGRVLPGKAIEVLDEAGARVRLTDGAQTVDAAVVAELFAEGQGPPRRFDDDRYVWAMS